MNQSWWISAGFGAALLVAGLMMMRSHYRTWQRQKSDPELAPGEVTFYRRRFRRRMQASGMMAVIGVMLPIGDSVKLFRPVPGWFAVYWSVVLLLVMWLFVLAMSDMLSTRAHSSVAFNKLRAQQLALEREAFALRQRLSPRRNGSHSSDPHEPHAE